MSTSSIIHRVDVAPLPLGRWGEGATKSVGSGFPAASGSPSFGFSSAMFTISSIRVIKTTVDLQVVIPNLDRSRLRAKGVKSRLFKKKIDQAIQIVQPE
jgi:hypothetical protein